MDRLRFCLNDSWIEPADVAPTTTLLRFLRDHLHLTATKEGCAEGDCGACTVAVVERDASGRPTYRALDACLVLLPMLQGKHVYTAEGLSRGGERHVAQDALAEALGSQCGYCTPGVVMSMVEATYRDDLDEPWKLDAQMCGNLCRCTGYRPIRDAVRAVAGTCPKDRLGRELESAAPLAMALDYRCGEQRFVIPDSVDAAVQFLARTPNARIVAGGTDLALEITKRFEEPALLVSLEGIAELRRLEEIPGGFSIGAGAPLTDVEAFARGRLPPLERMLRYFGSRQIKNRATVGGNLCTASPIGDLAPVFLALGAQAVLRSLEGERRVPLHAFFTAYRKTAVGAGELLAAVEVPAIPEGARACAYKVSKRRELDISTVSAAFLVEVDGAGSVAKARLAYGGMAPTPARAARAEAALAGRPWNEAQVEAAARALAGDFTPISDHRGSAKYRALVAANLLRGFYEETRQERLPRLPHPHTATVQAR